MATLVPVQGQLQTVPGKGGTLLAGPCEQYSDLALEKEQEVNRAIALNEYTGKSRVGKEQFL